MATKKAGGSSKNGRDSLSKRLGIKKFGGELIKQGEIIVRQRGSKYFPGENTIMGIDYTISAKKRGFIEFYKKNKRRIIAVRVCSSEG